MVGECVALVEEVRLARIAVDQDGSVVLCPGANGRERPDATVNINDACSFSCIRSKEGKSCWQEAWVAPIKTQVMVSLASRQAPVCTERGVR